MKLTFRPQAETDLRWFALYHAERVPEGRRKAEQKLRSSIELVLANPLAGRRMERLPARLFPVQHTPFVLIYTVMGDTIDILRVWDARSDPEDLSEN
jgi:plasmid stabilization system protein ParE